MFDTSRQNRSGQKEVNSSRSHAFLWAVVFIAVVSGTIVYAAEQAKEQSTAKRSEKCTMDIARTEELPEEAESKAETIDKSARDRTADGFVWNGVRRDEVDAVAADESVPYLKRLTAKALQAELKKDWQRAVTYWQTVAVETPKDPAAHFRLGYCAQSMAEEEPTQKVFWLQKTAEHYEHVVAIEPRHEVAYNNLGIALGEWAELSFDDEQDERFAEACRKYEKATTLNPEYADAYNNWGVVLGDWGQVSSGDEQSERFAEACRKYDRATKLDSEFADAFSNWGNSLNYWARVSSGEKQAERFAEACDKFDKATTLNSEHFAAYYNWGNALGSWARVSSGDEQAERFAGACRKYDRATQLNPELAIAYHSWGNALGDWAQISSGEEQAERFAKACRKYDTATKLDPEGADVYNNWGATLLTWARVSSGNEQATRLDRAEEKLRKAEELRPGSGGYNLALAAVLRNQLDGSR
jgi:tetratricopeptide (TPR) repeat protein